MMPIPVKSEKSKTRVARSAGAAVVTVLALAAAGCGSSASPTKGGTAKARAGGTYTILANAAPSGALDPAQNYTLQEWQLLIDTHDGLVQFQRVGGIAGTKIVPDLATAIPTPTDGGKTYLFHIRRGIKFSNGQVMKPSDFVTTFERQFTVPGPTSFYSGIVGASKCANAAKTGHCDLSAGVVADDKNYTVTIHLTAPDPELLDQLALPFAYVVPASTSPHVLNKTVPPGTGPYKWQSYNPNSELVLVRNPYFHVWSSQAQPAGYPDKIIEKFGLTVSDEVTAVENGQADEVYDGDTIPADRLSELNSPQFANQVHVNPLTADYYMALNTKVPPFNNVKARQAINYAADRSAYVKAYGGPSVAVPTCQILPPNFPGYKPYCPYTAGSDHSKWTGPDLAKARALVKASGTAGMKVTVNTDIQDKSFGEQMVADLNKIGYKASLVVLSSAIQGSFVQNSNNLTKWSVAFANWYQDYPAASDFLNVLLGCGSIHPGSDSSPNIAEFCNKPIQAQMSRAEVLGETNQTAANNLWAQIDHEVTNQAPWVDMFNPQQIDFLAKRVHGYLWNTQWYILIDQQWVK